MSLVEVRPLDLEKWHKKKGENNFASPKGIEARYSDRIGGYDTGLTPEEAKEYGAKLGVNLDNTFNPDEPHPFYGKKAGQVSLPAHTVIFNTSNVRDLVKVKLLKATSTRQVANSLAEWHNDLWPEATHYIHDEIEEAETKASQIAMKRKAVLITSELSSDAKRAYIMVLTGKNLKGKSDSIIDVEIDDIIEHRLKDFFSVHNMTKEEIVLTAQVKEMLSKNILTKQGTSIYYMSNQIAFDEKDAVRYFQDPNNDKMKALLLSKLG